MWCVYNSNIALNKTYVISVRFIPIDMSDRRGSWYCCVLHKNVTTGELIIMKHIPYNKTPIIPTKDTKYLRVLKTMSRSIVSVTL